MSRPANRTPLLLGAVVLLGALVAWRTFASAPSESSDDAPLTKRDEYLQSAERAERDRALLANAQAWKSAAAAAAVQWDTARAEMVKGRTPELAEVSFRERVLAEIKDLKFTESSANSVPPAGITPPPAPVQPTARPAPASVPTPSVRVIALKVDVRTDSPAEVYRLIDRLENLSDLRAGVVSLQIKGPGLAQIPAEVSATLQVHALALIGEDR